MRCSSGSTILRGWTESRLTSFFQSLFGLLDEKGREVGRKSPASWPCRRHSVEVPFAGLALLEIRPWGKPAEAAPPQARRSPYLLDGHFVIAVRDAGPASA